MRYQLGIVSADGRLLEKVDNKHVFLDIEESVHIEFEKRYPGYQSIVYIPQRDNNESL